VEVVVETMTQPIHLPTVVLVEAVAVSSLHSEVLVQLDKDLKEDTEVVVPFTEAVEVAEQVLLVQQEIQLGTVVLAFKHL
jgi:hypothetical protein